MNSKPVEALPEVEEDLEKAIAHYLTWRSDGRVHVLDKYDETVGWIEWNPDLFPFSRSAGKNCFASGERARQAGHHAREVE
jgi:hypothetical protein